VQMGQPLMLDLRQTDLVNLAQRIVGELKAVGNQITVTSNRDELDGFWDEARLSRVLSNLLDNAVNYSPPGSAVDIVIDDVRENGFEIALLRVSDRGRGIPAEDLPRVFERFYRGSNVRELTSGSGLGLAVARQIVLQHGGAISIDSRPGGGTIVSLRLPRKGPSEPILG
jgi:signal transduction histidine kinase